MFYGRHDLAEAIAEFSQALRLDPRHVGALRGRAKAYLAAGELDKAIRDLGEVIRIDPTDAHDFYARAGAYFLKEDLDKAMADANRAVSLAPFSADIHYVRAMLHARRGERQEGLADLDLAEQMERSAPKADHDGTCLDPRAGKLSFGDSPLVSICQRAGLCHQFGRLREAIALCDEALRLDHNNLDAHVIRAEALLDQGHFDGGLAELAEVIRIEPALRRYAYHLRTCQLRERKPEEAFRDFDKAVELAPNDASTRLDRGLSYVLHRELEKAAPDLRVAIKLGIDAADPKFRQAEASPVQVLNELVEMAPQMPEAYYLRATAFEEAAKVDRAMADLNEAVRLDPHFGEAYARRRAPAAGIRQAEGGGFRIQPSRPLDAPMPGRIRRARPGVRAFGQAR